MMKKNRVCMLVFMTFLLAGFVAAATCRDTDNGPTNTNLKEVAQYLATPGSTTDQFKTHTDACVRSELSDKTVNESAWLREYYCAGALAEFKAFRCSDYGFEKCVASDKGSYCKMNDTSGATVSSTSWSTLAGTVAPKKILADFYCGSQVMNRADAECYPPGRLCAKDKSPGECSSTCKCIVAGKKVAVEQQQALAKTETAPEEKSAAAPQKEAVTQSAEKSAEKKITPSKDVQKQKAPEQPIKQSITLRAIAALAHGVKKVWQTIIGIL